MRIAIKVLACVVGALGLVLVIALGDLAFRLQRAETTITTLCRDTRVGQLLDDFVARARKEGASLQLIAASDAEPGLATATAGVFTDVWTCEVAHDGLRILEVRASFQD